MNHPILNRGGIGKGLCHLPSPSPNVDIPFTRSFTDEKWRNRGNRGVSSPDSLFRSISFERKGFRIPLSPWVPAPAHVISTRSPVTM
jgi:hypothetical protein